MLIELGILLDILAQKIKQHLRNEQPDVCQSSLFSDAGPYLANEMRYILSLYKCSSFLHIHAKEISSVHDDIVLSCFWFCRRFRYRIRSRLCSFRLDSFKISLESPDLLFKISLFFVVCVFLALESVDRFSDGFHLFISGSLIDAGLEILSPGLEFSVFFQELLKGSVPCVDLLSEHQCFQCHYMTPFSFAVISARHASALRFMISSYSFFLAIAVVSEYAGNVHTDTS